MPKDEVALMRQVHDEHAEVLWRFCLRLVGQDRARAEDVGRVVVGVGAAGGRAHALTPISSSASLSARRA